MATLATMEEEAPLATLYGPQLPARLDLPTDICISKIKVLVVGAIPRRARRRLEVGGGFLNKLPVSGGGEGREG